MSNSGHSRILNANDGDKNISCRTKSDQIVNDGQEAENLSSINQPPVDNVDPSITAYENNNRLPGSDAQVEIVSTMMKLLSHPNENKSLTLNINFHHQMVGHQVIQDQRQTHTIHENKMFNISGSHGISIGTKASDQSNQTPSTPPLSPQSSTLRQPNSSFPLQTSSDSSQSSTPHEPISSAPLQHPSASQSSTSQSSILSQSLPSKQTSSSLPLQSPQQSTPPYQPMQTDVVEKAPKTLKDGTTQPVVNSKETSQPPLPAKENYETQGERSIVVAMCDYEPDEDNEIALRSKEYYLVVDKSYRGWWMVRNKRGSIGLVPSKHVKEQSTNLELERFLVPAQPKDKLQREGTVVVALLDFEPDEDNEIALRKNERYTVIDESYNGWWIVRDKRGSEGMVPSNYLEPENETCDGREKESSTDLPLPKEDDEAQEGDVVVARSDYEPDEDNEIALLADERYTVIDKTYGGWWMVRHKNGSEGLVPSKYFKEIKTSVVYKQESSAAAPLPKINSEEQGEENIVVAVSDYEPDEDNEIALRADERYTVLDKSYRGWWMVRNKRGSIGLVPSKCFEEESE